MVVISELDDSGQAVKSSSSTEPSVPTVPSEMLTPATWARLTSLLGRMKACRDGLKPADAAPAAILDMDLDESTNVASLLIANRCHGQSVAMTETLHLTLHTDELSALPGSNLAPSLYFISPYYDHCLECKAANWMSVRCRIPTADGSNSMRFAAVLVDRGTADLMATYAISIIWHPGGVNMPSGPIAVRFSVPPDVSVATSTAGLSDRPPGFVGTDESDRPHRIISLHILSALIERAVKLAGLVQPVAVREDMDVPTIGTDARLAATTQALSSMRLTSLPTI